MNKFNFIIALIMTVVTKNMAQENPTYQIPPTCIMQLADYQRAPQVSIDTKKEYMLLSYRSTYKSLDDLNQQEMSMGGLRVNPITNIASAMNYINNLKVRKVMDKEPIQVIGLPSNPRIAFVTWSPDETKIAFTNTSTKGVELWVLDVSTAKASKLTEAVVNANLGNSFEWYRDSKKLLVCLLAKNRPALIDSKNEIPIGPIVSVSDGSKSQNRTYPDLLKNAADETNFVTLTSSELYTIDLNANASLFKSVDMYANISFSPDGNYLLTTSFQKPFSYVVPLNRFPQISKVYDTATGNEVKTVNEVPLSEILPKGFMAVRTGKRSMNWRSDVPSTLYYAEALDGGDPQNNVEYRDAVYQWKAPFIDEPKLLIKTIQRFSHILWGNESVAILHDEWYDTRNEKTYLFNPSDPKIDAKIIFDRNFQDVYSDPGSFETWKNKYGKYVLAFENNSLFLIGEGHTEKGQFPFIDELNLRTLETKRLYQSSFTDKIEEIFDIEDYKKGEALVRIQSKNEYPNYYFRNFRKKNVLTQLTFFSNPFESIKDVYKELIKYKRADGVELSGTLYLPAGYDRTKKEKLPLLIWAYPAEYKDKNSAGQSIANENEFTYPYYGSFVYWVTRGYAVLDDAAFPIVGEGEEEPNDTFIEQLVSNAKAAIDAVDSLGFIDRNKVAVGGHSYGAFMTANLLTHCNLFACGIARSGAYNRTLTPFGFQHEQRNYWDVPEVYNTMSPFMNAEKMKTPILLVHGEADNNPGTFTLQTERYFQALKGLGAPARMLILPKEQHSYVARENILHLLWEQDQFLEKYLK